LISFWYTRIEASKAALKAMLFNRIGDISILFVVCLLIIFFKTLDFVILLNILNYCLFEVVNVFGYVINILDVLSCLVFFGAMGKSAQLFLHV
jgi:NADH-quinone oxidoreductase subunit L